MQNRRSFLGVLGAIGLYPIGARAFGTKGQDFSAIPKSPEKPQLQKFGKPPEKSVSNAKCFEAIIGDFMMNENEHVYRREIWESMFSGMPYHGPFVVYSDPAGRIVPVLLRLDHIAGRIVSYSFPDGKVKVRMEVMETPHGKIFRELAQQVPLFITPVGNCSSLPFHSADQNGVVPDDYRLKYFNLTNSSAFDCATPLHPVEERVLYATDENRRITLR